jgi:hypothetical protein
MLDDSEKRNRDQPASLEIVAPTSATASAMTRFPSFWGRGQQYLSLIRRRPWPTR